MACALTAGPVALAGAAPAYATEGHGRASASVLRTDLDVSLLNKSVQVPLSVSLNEVEAPDSARQTALTATLDGVDRGKPFSVLRAEVADAVATVEGGAALVARAVEEYGRIDAVVHNAGILRDRTFAKMTDEDVTAVLDVHLGGAFNVLRPAWPHMAERGYGRVVLTTSASGLLGTFGQASYAAAKAGLVGLMNVLALEGARSGILVNALSPTAATRMTEGLLGDLADRFDPRHVAAVATYLASERCELNRHILTVGGGRVGRIFLGVTPGWYSGPEPASPADVAAAIDDIVSLDEHIVPVSGQDEVALIQRVLGT